MDNEYKTHVKSLDRKYNNTQLNEKGPLALEPELEKYALVVGFGILSFGEWSKEVYELVTFISKHEALKLNTSINSDAMDRAKLRAKCARRMQDILFTESGNDI